LQNASKYTHYNETDETNYFSNRGFFRFGLLLATELHQKGYNVIGTSRNPETIQPKVPFKLLALDITDDDSIYTFGKKLFTEIDRLDVLITITTAQNWKITPKICLQNRMSRLLL
jgi:short-subunit dehydrogenase involved in D-alanine esterification of teichoic acids